MGVEAWFKVREVEYIPKLYLLLIYKCFFSAPCKEHRLDVERVGIHVPRGFLQSLPDTHVEHEIPKLDGTSRPRNLILASPWSSKLVYLTRLSALILLQLNKQII
jgi:hypothetical protein